MEKTKLVIIGSGPAGYTAAIYAARANLQPVVFEGFFSGPAGGQLMTTTDVENYPGFPEGITGPELMEAFCKQASRFGAVMHREDVESVDFSKRPFTVNGKNHQYEADSVIIATGATAKRLDVPGTRDGEFWQKGVTACAVCDGAMPIFRNKPLYVVGGGDSACEEALFLTKYASHVYVVHRRDELRASKIMGQRLINHPATTVIWDHVLEKVSGDDIVREVTIKNVKTGEESVHEAGGVAVERGRVEAVLVLPAREQVAQEDVGAGGMLGVRRVAPEGGLLMCSWPRGGRLSLPFVYSDEVWTGVEYHVAAHLMMVGRVEEALTIVRTARDRYDGRYRNPFDEYECGHWYARAMSSYAMLQGLTGARYDAVERVLHLTPSIQGDFRSFFCAAGGYGTVGVADGKPFLDVVSGQIDVDRIDYTPAG